MAWAAYTVDTLAAQIRGELDMDADAAGGTVPARLENLVRESGISLWNLHDWQFRRKSGTLTCADAGEAVAVPADFSELEQHWLRDTGSQTPLQFYTDPRAYQLAKDEYDNDDTGRPIAVMIVTDTAQTHFDQQFVWFPVSDQEYTFSYWYVTHDPWSVNADLLADDAIPVWPSTFHEGWHLYALARSQRSFRADDAWKETWAAFQGWARQQVRENDETITTADSDEYIVDGYRDMAGVRANPLDAMSSQWWDNVQS